MVHIRYFGREITRYRVRYNACVWFWPTLNLKLRLWFHRLDGRGVRKPRYLCCRSLKLGKQFADDNLAKEQQNG